ncbi:CHAT domain-containing tetratricopeptide repeat protein [Nostoc sp. UHCC 0251]|uniref:CHAT domain-containing protein n=1 Tax=Nostoc sp. UHCC 0251 TaxID=3110240 RepID=UPI002B20731E|nr:CHAT domain-containing tetratricopeptide repeat protein [Nostoc sp. UHCC 0251]MEA5622732.1 CHAT domain-containing tetratricopeptide repeat protein [Nostoc sp. UHCC 0251]
MDFKKAILLGTKLCGFSEILYKFPLGNKALNLEISINQWEICAEFISNQKVKFVKLLWAEIQCNLSLAYSSRIYGHKHENIEKAISACHEALKFVKREDMPEMWATIKNNLALAYLYRIYGEKADNLEQAISLLKAALPIHTRELFPKDWAKLQHNLGEAYFQRVKGDKAENLDKALMYLSSALEVYTKESFPTLWANSFNTLGAVFVERIHGDRAENLKMAIASFEAALQVRIREALPDDWAQTKLNLANAYRERIRGNQVVNLEIAIESYTDALQVYTKETFPREWAITQNNLGIAYLKPPYLYFAKNQERAIAAFESALQIYSQETFPMDWAMAQKNLGIVYSKRIIGNKPENLDKAIQYYEAAFQVFTRDSFPDYWAKNQNNLAIAYTHLGKIDKAIACCRFSLEIFTATAFPSQCLTASNQLGEIATNAKRWLEAIEGYSLAIEAVEISRSWAKSESRRQEILEEAIDVYEKMVQACINAGQIEKAFEYSERSRSKLLVDLMASYNLFQGEEIPPKVQKLLQQYEELQQQIEQERQSHKSENNRSETRAIWEERNQKIIFLERQKQQVWENIRREDPVLAGEIQVNPLKLSEIQKLIDQTNTAILSFYTTNSDTHIFVVQQNKITLHTCIGQGLDILQGWIEQNWLLPYRDEPKKWQTQINSILRELAECLQISELISEHLQGIEELILVPHRLLHQIPFTALPTGEYQEYLGDKFLIRYTPSCQILGFCQQRDTVGIFNEISLKYGTVEDAEDNLPCARFEGEKLAQIYNIPRENRLIGSNQATTKNYRQLAQQVQVLHSCHHAKYCRDNPLESQLKLADGSITLGQLMTPNWRLPQLVEVFLCCCETNLGTPSLTDDILTLSTGFLCAGARSVVSSLWLIDDLATALFSIFYYQHRQEGNSRPKALQQAQIKLRELKKEALLSREDIQEFYSQVTNKSKEAKTNRNQYSKGSATYLEWDCEYKKYRKVLSQIYDIKNSTQEFPFSDPRYWAAFICHGLR